jgi:hypothetical protein
VIHHININIQGVPSLLLLFSFFLGGKEPYWLAHHQFFQNIGHSPIEEPLSTPSCKLETNAVPYCLPFQFIYTRVELGQTIWDQTEVLLGTSWKTWGTPWEHIGNKKWKPPIQPSSSPKKKNRPPPHECMLSLLIGCMKKLIFSKTVCHHFWPGLMAGAWTVGHSTKV